MQARRGPLARQVVACYRRQVEFASLKGARRLHGHALAGVRVKKVQRVQRFDTAFGREGYGGRLRCQYECRLRRRPLWCLSAPPFPPASLVGLWMLSDGAT